jgi:hypothetical protein
MSRLVIESDTRGWYEPDGLLTPDEAELIRREFARHPWPPIETGFAGFSIMGVPTVVEDRRPKPKRTVARVDIDAHRTPSPPQERD